MGLRGRASAVTLAAAALAAGAAGCGGSSEAAPTTRPATTAPQSPFAYDTSRPLAFRNNGRVNSPYPIAVDDVSYAAPSGRVPAYLALPNKARELPAVIYLHGSGEGRERFLLPAVWAAGRRAVGMTLTLPSSSAGAPPAGLSPAQSLTRDRRIFASDVVAVRRAVDVLRSLPQVDPKRIGLVGWSLGARVAAVTAGAEPRLRAVVLMSGGSLPVSAYVAQTPAALRAQVRRSLTQIDPLRWLARAHPGEVMLQDGRKDEIVPRAALVALQKAAPRGSVVRWYPAGHELNAQVYRDQLAFLAKRLPIEGPSVPGARTGP
jgi:dienelactone hydrolase